MALGLRIRPVAGLCAVLALALAGCGSQESREPARTAATAPAHKPAAAGAAAATATTVAPASPPVPAGPARPVSSTPHVSVPAHYGSAWRLVATVREAPAAWIAERDGVTLLRFDQRYVHLALHAGGAEPGGSGWPYGDQIGAAEVHRVIAGFNGGFKFSNGSVGFVVGHRVAAPLSSGLASIVTYADGTTNIGAWHEGVPAHGVPIASVRQNLRLLVDRGEAAANVESCVQECWGSTLGGGSEVPRSGLGIDGEGRLVWGASMRLSPAGLARGLISAGVQRAVELDINPAWVAGYLYVHRSGGPVAVPVVPGQNGIAGELLEPDSRDFFTVIGD